MKKYTVTIALQSVDIKVTAKNKREAKKLAIEKLKTKNLAKLLDKYNTDVEELIPN